MEIVIIMITSFVLYFAEGILYEKLWKKGLDAEVEISPRSAFPEDKATLFITLSNRKLLPLPWLWLKLHISSTLHFENDKAVKDKFVYRNALFCIMGWQQIKRKLIFKCTKRGYYTLRSFEVVGSSILFNGKHMASYPTRCAITVYPALADLSQIAFAINRLDGTIASSGFINPDPFEFSGIREYVSSDSFRDINFRASAHTGTLMTNTHNPAIKGDLTIILCTKPMGKSFEEECFEHSISLGAALAERYLSKGFSVSLLSNNRDCASGCLTAVDSALGESQLTNIYEALARLSYNDYEDISTLTPCTASNSHAIFICPFSDDAVVDLYHNIKSKYASALWLYSVMEFDIPHITAPEDSIIVGVAPSTQI